MDDVVSVKSSISKNYKGTSNKIEIAPVNIVKVDNRNMSSPTKNIKISNL